MSAKLFKSDARAAFTAFVIPSAPVLPVPEETAPLPEPVSEPSAAKIAAEVAQANAEAAQAAAETLRQAADEAARIVAEAHAEAARIIAATQAQAAELEREARERGLAEARAGFDHEVRQSVADLRERLSSTIDEVAGLRTAITAHAERDLVKLALEIARKIIRREVAADQDIVVTLARIALERLPSRVAAKVRISPEDFEYVTANSQSLGPDRAVELIADFAIKRGGCVVQSEGGSIDARIEEQLAIVEKGLLHH